MNDYLPFILSGIAIGSIYGLAAAGLTLTYQTSGIFNFGYGALATAAAYLFYFLHVDHGLPWLPALIIVVFVAGPLMGVVMERIARQLAPQRTAWKIIGTVGLILVVEGAGTIAYGLDPRIVEQYLPMSNESFRLGGVNVLYPQLWVTVLSVVVVAVSWVALRRTSAGVSMRAVVDDPDLVAMQAISPVRVRRTAAVYGASLAALSGVLILPFVGLDSIGLTLLVVQAFGAAAIGRFSNLPLTFVGAVLIGIVSNVSIKFVIAHSSFTGLPSSVPLIVLFVVLMVTSSRKLGASGAQEARQHVPWKGPSDLRAGLAVVVVVILALVPLVAGSSKLPFFTIGLTEAIMLLSLGLLVKTSGQVSLCHATFAAIGAVTFSQLTIGQGLSWPVALVVAALVVAPVGALVAIPAIRLSGIYLALATFAFAIVVEQMFFARDFMFTTLAAGREIPRPSFATGNTSYYYLVLVFAVLIAVLTAVVHRVRLGRMLLGLSESPVAISTMGLNTKVTRVVVFVLSAMLAAVAGILYGGTVHFADSADTHYGFMTSLTLLAILGLAPFGAPWYALFGIIGAVIPGYFASEATTNWLNVVFGVFAVITACTGGPPPMPVPVRRFLEGLSRRRVTALPATPALDALSSTPEPRRDRPTGRLEVKDLTVRFGGLVALDEVSFRAEAGQITGIIGPNGAGKTTLFDACSGLNRRIGGEIWLHERRVDRQGPAVRARMGLGRTFQSMHLADSLTVSQNVALGTEAAMAGANPFSQVLARPGQGRAIEAAVAMALHECGISHLADLQVGALSTGQRRLVELARCLAGSFDLLLLDEPSSGLDAEETAQLGALLKRLRVERGCGILLVEHDMSLVMDVCSYIYVLDFGKLIFEGEREQVERSPIVREAYLGAAPTADLLGDAR